MSDKVPILVATEYTLPRNYLYGQLENLKRMNDVEDKININQTMNVASVKTAPVPPKRVTVLYHRGCTDGWCSAYLLKKKFPNAVLMSVSYNENPPELPDTDLLMIVDFSYPKETLLDLKSNVKEIIVLDHHKTAKEQLEGLDFCTFDMNESGASLVSAYLKKLDPTYKEPWIVSYVKDRDLWTWTLPESRAVSAFIRTFDTTVEDWDKLIATDISVASKLGQAVLIAQKQIIEIILKGGRRVMYDGHEIIVVNSPCYQSEIGEAIYETGVAFGVIYNIRPDGKVNVSFRSKSFDVAREAMRYGGGGHKFASGCVFHKYEDFVREIIRA